MHAHGSTSIQVAPSPIIESFVLARPEAEGICNFIEAHDGKAVLGFAVVALVRVREARAVERNGRVEGASSFEGRAVLERVFGGPVHY